MKTISLTKGFVTIVDDADFPYLNQFRWHSRSDHQKYPHIYAERSEKTNGRWRAIKMHRELMNPPAEMVIDHINHDCLDNRRSNLRICTHNENLQNRRPDAYPYQEVMAQRGITKEANGKWRTTIYMNKRNVTVGRFTSQETAALAFRLMSMFRSMVRT